MSRRYGGQSPLAVDAMARGATLPPSAYFERHWSPLAGWFNVRTVEPKLPHLGQIRKMQRRGFKR